jgi:large subunit ribosomal protein L28
MAKICQVSGKKANTTAKHIRNQHSQGWKYKAPHKNRTQAPNLQWVRLKTPTGTYRLLVSTNVLKSPEYNQVACGLKPIPKEWLKRPDYNLS